MGARGRYPGKTATPRKKKKGFEFSFGEESNEREKWKESFGSERREDSPHLDTKKNQLQRLISKETAREW